LIDWPNYPCENDWWGCSLLREGLADTDRSPLQNADFQSIFARSASAVTAGEKVQLTLIESPLHA